MLCILIGLLSLLCDAQSPTFTRATDIAVSSSGQVFVGDSGKGVLYRLDSSLVQQESVALPSGGSILRLVLTPDESKLVTCLTVSPIMLHPWVQIPLGQAFLQVLTTPL